MVNPSVIHHSHRCRRSIVIVGASWLSLSVRHRGYCISASDYRHRSWAYTWHSCAFLQALPCCIRLPETTPRTGCVIGSCKLLQLSKAPKEFDTAVRIGAKFASRSLKVIAYVHRRTQCIARVVRALRFWCLADDSKVVGVRVDALALRDTELTCTSFQRSFPHSLRLL